MKTATSSTHKKACESVIELNQTQLDALLARVESGNLEPGDYEIIKTMVECLRYLSQRLDEKAATIKRLLRMIFGVSTEKREKILPTKNDSEQEPSPVDSPRDEPPEEKPKCKGHGRNGVDSYTGAHRERIAHAELKAQECCPECMGGKLYASAPGIEIRLTGAPPVQATIYEQEKLRCDLCGTLFTAALPVEVAKKKKYDATAIAMIALLKYGTGMPFNRLEALQGSLGVPLPSSTQWDIIKGVKDFYQPVYLELIRQAAQGEVFYNDDTNMKVLSLMKENHSGEAERTGMFTTGIVVTLGQNRIALFFTGRKCAGENLNFVLSHRQSTLVTPLQICDALDRNVPQEFKTMLINCLIHARRNFVNAAMNFPDECSYVIDMIAKIYQFEAITKDKKMTPQERLLFHQANSGPIMEELHQWMKAQMDEKKVEPNSGLGGAIKYMLKRWERFTAFLRIAGAPLDNNTAERALKKAILNRKNSLFYKSENGAAVGDMFMSLIYTCELAGVNPHHYLTVLLNFSDHAKNCPQDWLPWTYSETLSRLKT